MTKEHSPGNWYIKGTHPVNGMSIKTDALKHFSGAAKGRHVNICQVSQSLMVGRSTSLGNARLICAAPCLLEALKMVNDHLENGEEFSINAGEVVRAAIAKAEGR